MTKRTTSNTRLSYFFLFRPVQFLSLSLVLILLLPGHTQALIELRTSAKTNQMTATQLQDYLARPIHWPQIVASSDSVKSDTSYNVDEPLQVGSQIQEFFGLNLLSVNWTCTKNEPGKLVVKAPEGLPGIAKQCSMKFDITEDGEEAKVVLTMGYDPLSLVALVATPVLVLDNWIALKVLLPRAIQRSNK